VGQAARVLEEKGFSTIVLTPTPEFNNMVGIPRSVGIAYPYGRLLGDVGDLQGQREVLKDTLMALEAAATPGSVQHLPYVWPEEPKEAKWHPPDISPIVKLQLDEIKKARKKQK
jgi:hypothetical protein